MNDEIDIRETLLIVIHEQSPKRPNDGASLQSRSVLSEVARRTGVVHNRELEQAVLTQFHDLFRTGYLAWGHNMANPDPPWFHLTDSGRRLLERLTRDPGNPAGYRAHVGSVATINAIAASYLNEAVDCYANGLYKATAVMTGAAAESLILELRDEVVTRLNTLKKKKPKDIDEWRIKRVLDALHMFFSNNRNAMLTELRDEFEAYWAAFAQQIRTVRNEAGHPSSVLPVTTDTVHASLLIFPELARLQNKLKLWTNNVFS